MIKNETLFNKLSKINVRSYTMIIALVAIWLIFWIFSGGSFLYPQNISKPIY